MRQEMHGALRYCRKCNYFTRKANTLSMHMMLKHATKHSHFCQSCPASYPTQIQLKHHAIKHVSATIKCISKECLLQFKTTATQRTHYVRRHIDRDALYTKLLIETDMCKCLSCAAIFTINAIVYHVSSCSPLSPFNKSAIALCLICPETIPTPLAVTQDPDEADLDMHVDIDMESEMVLNRADEDMIMANSFLGLDDISDDICVDLMVLTNAMFQRVSRG